LSEEAKESIKKKSIESLARRLTGNRNNKKNKKTKSTAGFVEVWRPLTPISISCAVGVGSEDEERKKEPSTRKTNQLESSTLFLSPCLSSASENSNRSAPKKVNSLRFRDSSSSENKNKKVKYFSDKRNENTPSSNSVCSSRNSLSDQSLNGFDSVKKNLTDAEKLIQLLKQQKEEEDIQSQLQIKQQQQPLQPQRSTRNSNKQNSNEHQTQSKIQSNLLFFIFNLLIKSFSFLN